MATKFKGIKTAAEYRRGEICKDILRLVGAGVVVGTAVVAPNAVQLIDYLNPAGRAERNRIWKAIKYLEDKHRLRIEDRGDTQYIHLTREGKRELDELLVWEIAIKQPRFWDHKWRLVMFDFPTSYRDHLRHSFRLKLEDLGFIQYQRSVFIYPHECAQEIDIIADWFNARDHVRYIVATEINDMRRFVKEFGLLGDL